ncbi:MAG: sigma-70 family RNA polymerase sigma factor [Chloroflexia bacterium]|nr:sigma-70 family RNA polymerase sigma factor [Chloroflexia bacterium]
MADPAPAATRDDEHLLRAAREGDLDAFNLLVLRHQGAVFNVCLRLLRDVAAAEDATQDAFVRAWTGAHSFRGGSVRAWLFKIATNRAYDLLRVRARRPAAALEADALELEPVWPSQVGELPEERVLRDELGIRLERALAGLPEDQRTAVLLADVQGCSYEEVAAATGSALGTVKSRLSRARARLRQSLTDDPGAAELFARFVRLDGERAAPAPAADPATLPDGAASPPVPREAPDG